MKQRAKFFCDFCGEEVKQNDKFCKKCGKFFSSVKCPQCGQTGDAKEFVNGCPRCGYAERGVPSRGETEKTVPVSRGDEGLPLWVYLVCAVFLLTTLVFGYIWFF